MPLPVSARSFLPNPLTGIQARQSGFEIGKQSSNFANFVNGAFQGAETTTGLIKDVQEIQARPGEIARRDQEQARRERRSQLAEEKFEFEKGPKFDFTKEKTERQFELDEEKINLQRKKLAQQANKAAITRRKEAKELGIENALVQVEQGNIDGLLAEFQEDAGVTSRMLLENTSKSDKRRDRAVNSLGNFLRRTDITEAQRNQANQIFELVNDQAYLMDNLKKVDAAYQLLDSNHYPVERSDRVRIGRRRTEGGSERILGIFDKNGKEKYKITESDVRGRSTNSGDKSEKDVDAFFGAGRRIEDAQRKQKELLENSVSQVAKARARQAGQPAQEERPAKVTPRKALRPGETGIAPAANVPRDPRDQTLVRGGRGPTEIASPRRRRGERQLRDIAGVRQRGERELPLLDPKRIGSPLF